jgi:hypothetical protein
MAVDLRPSAKPYRHSHVARRTGKPADRQTGTTSGEQLVGDLRSGSSPDDRPLPRRLQINNADWFKGRYAACPTGLRADMQTAIRAGVQATTAEATWLPRSKAKPLFLGNWIHSETSSLATSDTTSSLSHLTLPQPYV